MPEYKIRVVIDPTAQTQELSQNEAAESIIPEDVAVSKQNGLVLAAKAAVVFTFVKRVADYAVSTSGLRSGNYDRQNRIQSTIATAKGLVDVIGTAKAVYEFNTVNNNSMINAQRQQFISGTFVNGGR
jgi:hypothetical protein